MAEVPTWANGCSSSRFRVARINSFCSEGVSFACDLGALEQSLYHSVFPVWYRFNHLKNHFFERFKRV
jgi:hypothetical protein